MLRSLEESLTRLGLDRADVVLVHDPDDHLTRRSRRRFPALAALRDQGVVGAVGAGMNQSRAAAVRREVDLDCVLLAGRYTLLDHSASAELLPLCRERGVAVLAGGVFNSGVLADPRDGATFDYEPRERRRCWSARAASAAVCARHGVALPVAATAFPLRHPAVACVLVGARSPREVADDIDGVLRAIPDALWADLEAVAT